MRNRKTFFAWAVGTLIAGSLVLAAPVGAEGPTPSSATCKAGPKDKVTQGGCIAIDKKKGNCMACHLLAGGSDVGLQQGNIAPPLVAMKNRLTKERIRDQLNDPHKFNAESVMPPFGKHHILTQDEIDKVAEFVMSL